MVRYDYIAALCVFCVATLQYGSAKMKSYQSNGRVSGVIYTTTVRSLIECSIIYENSETSLSFNFRRDTKSCELSTHYPEHYTTTAVGWQVYARIVDGVWTTWTNWDSCTVTCGGGTIMRTRSCTNPAPSNGGEQCPGHSTDILSCHDHDCPVDGAWAQWVNWGTCTLTCGSGTRTRTRTCTNPTPSNGGASCPDQSSESELCNTQACPYGPYFISTSQVTWDEAKVIHGVFVECEVMSGTLVIIDEQAEQDYLESSLSGMHHWIGLRCQIGENCTWVDGRNLEGGFINWAPEEPKDRDCVWIGWYTNKWDDDYCDVLHEFICEL